MCQFSTNVTAGPSIKPVNKARSNQSTRPEKNNALDVVDSVSMNAKDVEAIVSVDESGNVPGDVLGEFLKKGLCLFDSQWSHTALGVSCFVLGKESRSVDKGEFATSSPNCLSSGSPKSPWGAWLFCPLKGIPLVKVGTFKS